MTYYDWICNDCEVIWDQEHPLGEAPKQTECPECGELRDRNWGSVSTFHMKGECHTNRVRLRKEYNEGMDKDTAEEFYKGSIKQSEKTIATGWQHYKKVTPDIKKMREAGVVTKRTEKAAKESVERAKTLTQTVYNDIGADIGETLHRKPQ